MRSVLSVAGASIACLMMVACTDGGVDETPPADDTVLLQNRSFVPIPRTVDDDTLAQRQDAMALFRPGAAAPDDQDFYLAIHKDALKETWFVSAFMKQYYPGGVDGGGAQSLGTRVVTFRQQNDRLYMFDVDNRKATSDVFDPDVIVEAWPIIAGFERFQILPGHRNYVLIDPSAGLNRFSVMGDAFGTGSVGGDYQPRRFEVELSYLQRFRETGDGMTYEHIFTGYSEQPLPQTNPTEWNPFRASGTMTIALRKYKEGENYKTVDMPWSEHYFRSEPRIIKNDGSITSVAAHWDLYEGMEPVVWHISNELQQLDATMPSVDLVGAVQKGIEGWNDALGFTAFTTVLATPADSFADDDKNFVIFDPDSSLGYAFANWRTNPNTGEIRGASIYIGRGWILDDYFPPEEDTTGDIGTTPADAKKLLPLKEKQPIVRLTWDAVSSDPLCVYWAPNHRHRPTALPEDLEALTNSQKIERYLTHVVSHEIGHTLSLRHNFKGSLQPPSSSVMDYTNIDIRIATDRPGSYDIAAVRYLYGVSTELPTEPFCTDGDYFYDPDCAVFDSGATPLTDMHIPDYEFITTYFLQWGLPLDLIDLYMGYYGQGLLSYIRAGSYADKALALQTALGPIGAPLDQSVIDSSPDYGPAADALTMWVLDQLYLADEADRGYITNDPTDAATVTAVIDQASQILTNSDGIRSFPSRRKVVDLLVKFQSTEAYLALKAARAELETQQADGSLTLEDEALLADLIARVDAALSPYFE